MDEERIRQVLESHTEKLISLDFNQNILQKVLKAKKKKGITSKQDINILVGCLVLAALWRALGPILGMDTELTLTVLMLLLLLPCILIGFYAIQTKTNK